MRRIPAIIAASLSLLLSATPCRPADGHPSGIRKGCTKAEVRDAWGKPSRRSTSLMENELRLFTQWVYPDRRTYVYFIGNRVCDIQPMFRPKDNKKLWNSSQR